MAVLLASLACAVVGQEGEFNCDLFATQEAALDGGVSLVNDYLGSLEPESQPVFD